MRTLLMVFGAMLVFPVSSDADFLHTFTGPDGSFPDGWIWTHDTRGDGAFLIHDNAFAHVDGGYAHYTWSQESCGPAIFEFDAKDTHWAFAWRLVGSEFVCWECGEAVPEWVPECPTCGAANSFTHSGDCLRLHHNDEYGWGYNVDHFSWHTLPYYPNATYWWHNGSPAWVQHSSAAPHDGWSHVKIADSGSNVRIWVDGMLIFDLVLSPSSFGCVGLGSSGGAEMTPAFDNLSCANTSVTDTRVNVEPVSWSRVKSIFR
jgi:hypothetical protein